MGDLAYIFQMIKGQGSRILLWTSATWQVA